MPFSTFINDFNDLCECLSSEQNLYIFGDFNLHFENTSDPCSSQFRLLLNEHELINCNIEKTHVSGHTLDLCLFRCADSAFIDLPTFEDLSLSDHFVMTASLPFSKPNHVKSTIKKRNISNIDLNSFELALNESLTNIKDELTSFSFHQCVLNVLNTFAPIKNRLTVIRPAAPWFNLVIKAQKQVRRRAERLFRKTKLTVHKQIMKFQKNKTIKIINQEKKKYISDQISSCKNSKQLYSVLNKLTCKNKRLSLPTDTPIENLPDVFNDFFVNKISTLRNALVYEYI